MSALKKFLLSSAVLLAACTVANAEQGGNPRANSCQGSPSPQALRTALINAVANPGNGGLHLNMWATIVANDGTVCAVVYSGDSFTKQWLASRVISAQKASTANGLSLGVGSSPAPSGPGGLALSTANLYSAGQPGGSLYGLQFSNPVDPENAYSKIGGGASDPAFHGTPKDGMVGNPIGGVNVFGGGLALYAAGGKKVGGIGVSGDTSCTDHFVAWRVRKALNLDHFGSGAAIVGGVSGDADRPDNIVYDIIPNPNGGTGNSAGGFGHPPCLNGSALPPSLPAVQHN